jgi:hypothetical protein
VKSKGGVGRAESLQQSVFHGRVVCRAQRRKSVDGREAERCVLCVRELDEQGRRSCGPRPAEEGRHARALRRGGASVTERGREGLDRTPVWVVRVEQRHGRPQSLFTYQWARVRDELEHDGDLVRRARPDERVQGRCRRKAAATHRRHDGGALGGRTQGAEHPRRAGREGR